MLLAVLFSGVLLVLVGADKCPAGRFAVCGERVSGFSSFKLPFSYSFIVQLFVGLPLKKRKASFCL